jgi:hypothetical protein
MMMKSLILAAALALAGCAGTPVATSTTTSTTTTATASTPAFSDATAGQAMATARTSYDVAVRAATVYGRLPQCSLTQGIPCHTATLLSQLQKADTAAYAALDAGDLILRQPTLGTTARDRAIAAAQLAVSAFQTLTGATK